MERDVQSASSDLPSDLPFVWCVVANMTKELHPENGSEALGSKRFAPGAKLYCFPSYWGDGGRKIAVLGRHRNSAKLIKIIVDTKWFVNWRVKKIYDPHIVERMKEEWTEESAKAVCEWRNKIISETGKAYA